MHSIDTVAYSNETSHRVPVDVVQPAIADLNINFTAEGHTKKGHERGYHRRAGAPRQ